MEGFRSRGWGRGFKVARFAFRVLRLSLLTERNRHRRDRVNNLGIRIHGFGFSGFGLSSIVISS